LVAPDTFKLNIRRRVAEVDQAIQPGQYLVLKDDSVWSYNARRSEAASGYVLVATATNVPVPQVSIRGPTFLDGCPDLNLEVITLGGSTGRPWSAVTITFEASVSDATDSQLTSVLNDAALLLKAGKTFVKIQRDLLVGRSYTLTLSFTNFLGGFTNVVFSFNKVVGTSIPLVTLKVPPGQARIGQSFSIDAIVEKPPSLCQSNATRPEFEWISETITINTNRNRGSSYSIEPFTLDPDTTYTITARVNYAGSSDKFNFTTSFSTETERLKIISGRSKRVNTDVAFDLSPEFRSTSNVITISNYECTWTCEDSDSNTCSFLNGFTLPFSCDTLTVPASSLDAGTYKFYISAQKTRTGVTTVGMFLIFLIFR
jgi:hypothetical protein